MTFNTPAPRDDAKRNDENGQAEGAPCTPAPLLEVEIASVETLPNGDSFVTYDDGCTEVIARDSLPNVNKGV